MGFYVLALLVFLLLLVAVRPAIWNSIRTTRRVEREMDIAARICEAAARDAFGIELDHSLSSLALLDQMILQEWVLPGSTTGMATATRRGFAAYFGDVFVRSYSARWSIIGASTEEPRLEFPKCRVIVDPFALLQYKLQDPESVHLAELGDRLCTMIESRSKLDWHTLSKQSVTFDPEAPSEIIDADEQ